MRASELSEYSAHPFFQCRGLQRLAKVALLSLLAVTQAAKASGIEKGLPFEPTGAAERRLVQAIADRLLPHQMERHKVPGAVVALVAAGEILLLKGYGWADLATRQRVDPNLTVFHTASIAKALTATAVLQLAERGRLALHEDVNAYLTRFQVAPTFSEPLSAHHLLTHTAGLDGHSLGHRARAQDEMTPLVDFLARRMPPRIRPPGLVSVYSHMGFALAGLLVEDVSRQPFAHYMRSQVFRPLGMMSSSFELTPAIQRRLASGYDWRGRTVPPDRFRAAPAAMLLSTGGDLARWMIAVLEGGADGDRRILEPQSAALLISRQFSNHPLLPGRSYGLSEGTRHDSPEYLHAGSASGFTSALVLVPTRRFGLFVAFNSQADIWETVHRLLESFEEDWGKQTSPPRPEAMPIDTARFSGYYRDAELGQTTVEKMVSLIKQERVDAAGQNQISWRSQTWEAIQPLVFRRVGDDTRLAFLEQDGLIRYLATAGTVQVRLGWFEAQPTQLTLWALFMIFFLLLAIGWLGAQLPARRRRLEPQDAFRPRWPFVLIHGAAILHVIFVIALFSGLAWILQGGGSLEYGVPTALYLVLALPLLAGAMTVVATVAAPIAWWRRFWTRGARLRFTAAALVLLVFLPFLASWNLLGFRL